MACRSIGRFIIIQATILVLLRPTKAITSDSDVLLVLWSSSSSYNTSTIVSSAVEKARFELPMLTPSWSNVHIVERDTMCNENKTISILEEYVHTDDGRSPRGRLTAIIGFGCPSVTSSVITYLSSRSANNLTDNTVPVISYDSHGVQAVAAEYPSLFRTSPSLNGLHNALAAVMEYFKWKRALLISERINLNVEDFDQYLLRRGISLYEESTENEDIFPTSSGVHILDAYGPSARRILCQAYKESVYYPEYAWLILDNFIDEDWYTVADTSCSTTQLQRVLRYSIIIGTSPDNTRENIFTYSYNALTAVSLALHNQIGYEGKNDEHSQTWENISIADLLREVSMFDNVSFTDSNDSQIVFTQLTNSDENQFLLKGSIIGGYTHSTLTVNQSSDEIWPEGVPNDVVPTIVIEKVKTWAFVLTILLSMVGAVCIVACFLFVFLFRKSKLIKLTSPNLNYLLLLGAAFVFLSIILYGIPSTDRHVFDVLCPIQPFFGSIFGYDLCVTITTIKLWRLYYIFNGPKQAIPKDRQLFIGIGAILSIDCTFSIILIVIEVLWFPPELIHENKQDSTDPVTGEVYTYYFWDCRHSTYIFTIVALVHNFIVHGIGIWFAYRLRKIEVTVLNEYKYNLAILFVSVTVTVTAVVLIYSVGADPSLYAFFYSLLITIGCVAFICLTFVPKMIALKKDPNGDRLFPSNIGNNNIKAYENSSERQQSVSYKPPPNTITNTTTGTNPIGTNSTGTNPTGTNSTGTNPIITEEV